MYPDLVANWIITAIKGAVEGCAGRGGAKDWSTTIGVTVSEVPCGVSTGRTLLPCVGAWAPMSTAGAEGRTGGGGRRGRGMHTMLVGSRGLYKLVGRLGPRVVDDFQQENKHHPFEKGRGVRKGGQVFSLAKQVGVGLGEQVDPRHLIVISAFDSREDEGKEVFAVEEPVHTKKVENVEDTWVFERLNPALGHQPYATRRMQTSRLGRGRALPADLLGN